MATYTGIGSSARAGARGATAKAGYPASSPAFDWLMGTLSILLIGGVIQDGWAHAHGEVDQSFLTPWHAVLYGSMALNGFVLGGIALFNLRRGYALKRTLPYGYWLALGGVVLFAAGGAFDLAWHSFFGIETGINGLLSPSHLLLALSAVLVFSGALRSIARQYGPQTGGWRRVGPAVLASIAVLVLLGFFSAYAQPIEDGFTSTTIGRDPNPPLVAGLYGVDARGLNETRLSLPPNLDIWGVTAARDGRIAYRAQAPHVGASDALAKSDLYVANADGTHAVRITHAGRHDTQPAWSPDGTQLAYVSMPAGTSGNFELRVVRANGSDQRTLVSGTTTLTSPAWSPDGKSIAYASRRGTSAMLALVPVAGGSPQWLEATKGASAPVWRGTNLIFSDGDGALRIVAANGGAPRRLVAKGASQAAVSFDGTQIAYLATAAGGSQVFVAAADGSHPRNVSQLSGLDAAHPAWTSTGSIVFSATGRPAPERTDTGYGLAEAANLLQAVLLSGIMLLAVRRWRVPFGAFTLALPLFALAMATQSDAYYDAIPALVTGLLADLALVVWRDRLRTGAGFYAFAFALPATFFALYLFATIQAAGGSAWTPDMLLGSPLLAGCAGLLVAFCYEPPLPKPLPG